MKLTKKIYATRAEKRRDLALGVGVFFGLNFLLFSITTLVFLLVPWSGNSETEILFQLISLNLSIALPLLINSGAIVYFALTRTWIALGMIATIGSLIGLTLLLGIILSVACFATVGSGY